MELTERDLCILRLVYRFRFCLGRHLKVLSGFSGIRATDRRLKILVEAGYLTRNKYMYGVPYLYTLTHKGRILLGANKREDKVRIDRIAHDIYVLDTVIFYMKKYNVDLQNIETEKELHIKDGFGARTHHPDFIIKIDSTVYAIEIELHHKTKERFEKNIRDNYLNFDRQVWITNDNKVISLLHIFSTEYSNIDIIRLEEVIEYVKE